VCHSVAGGPVGHIPIGIGKMGSGSGAKCSSVAIGQHPSSNKLKLPQISTFLIH